MSKPANHYASTTPIPDWIESEILELSKDGDFVPCFVMDLGLCLYYGDLPHSRELRAYHKLGDRAYEWLDLQDVDVFKALLQWVSMELI